jgi:hypothetical protein
MNTNLKKTGENTDLLKNIDSKDNIKNVDNVGEKTTTESPQSKLDIIRM